jgi:hypothetical protein
MGTIGLVQTVLGILLLGIGLVACVLMLEVLGRPGRAEDPSGKRAVHRLLGRVFVVLYAVLFVWMLPKAAYYSSQNEPYTIRVFAHVFLALAMVPLLAIKVAIVKRYKALMQSTPWLGILIVSFIYIVVVLTAGHEVVGMLKSIR